jgi:rhodanese-related sulfurtransferase
MNSININERANQIKIWKFYTIALIISIGANIVIFANTCAYSSSSVYSIYNLLCDIDSLKKSSHTLIDIRHESYFKKLHIPSSINIPLFALKTKSFLKKQNIILINQGYGYQNMLATFRILDHNGFQSVKILKGGLNAWYQADRPIVGDIFQLRELNLIPPDALYADQMFQHILIVEIYKNNQIGIDQYFPKLIPVQLKTTSAALDTINNHIINDKKTPLYVVIIFGKDVKKKHLKTELYKKIMAPVFFIKGGLGAYKTFIETQFRLTRKKNQVIKKRNCSLCN